MKTGLNLKLTIASLTISLLGFGQPQAFVEIKLEQPPTAYSVDTEYNFYLGFTDGRLIKYSPQGEELQVFSLPNQSEITLVEAINNRKIFLFQRDIQKISVLDRFATIPQQYNLLDYEVNYALSACPNPDGSIWVVDNNPQRLQKIDLLRNVVVQEVQEFVGDTINFMRSRQNLLYVAHPNGIIIFDQFGNRVSESESDNPSYIQLLNNQLLISGMKSVDYLDAYDLSTKSSISQADESIRLDLKSSYVLIGRSSIKFFTLESPQKE